jgi:glycosyltransferase involved in cell wall biosynthesis
VKILILHHHFKTPQSGGAIRSYYLAKALVDKGHQAVVITTHNEKSYRQEDYEGIDVHYLPIAYDNRFQFYQRGRSFLRYIFEATRFAKKFSDFDYCYAISVPLTIGIAAIRIKNRFKIPFYFEVGDLWPDAPIQLGFVQNYFLKKFLFSLERTIYKNAKRMIALSPSIKSTIEKKISDKKVFVIPNMADTNFYKPEPKNPLLQKKYDVENKFVVSYIGALGVANGLDYFLECARASQKHLLAVHFLLCGDGAMGEYLNTMKTQLQLDNVSIIPFKNRDGVKELINVTDASFICYKPVSILETGSPNKFFDGLAAGKLILINFGGWIKKEIEENECGVYLNPNQPSEFVTKILPFVENPSQLSQSQQRSRALAEKKYSREKLSDEFLKILSQR